ncbi:tumor necrosis factor receptor superfamily member 18 [Misgurnus anguillicaudatus]|uniref:tumor necrosis factor receptor superfamily member 18 n=1 Tax=Misgurnus anguillicaudatus TaxID=75329 RepID=UPI003CCFC9FF
MDSAKFWFTLLCVCSGWILTLAISCDWTTQYENDGKCCQVCPTGMYPTQHCSESNGASVCAKCPDTSVKRGCFCENKLCSDDKCSKCVPIEQCEPGFQLWREGNFDFGYKCEPCSNGTYNDVKGGTCKPFAKCDGFQLGFAGNSTHNARCINHENLIHVSNKELSSNHFSNIMMLSLTAAVILCLVLIVYTAFQHWKHTRRVKSFQPCTHKMVLPPDACSCKLSKEEMGDEIDSKETSEFSFTCDGHSFP